MIAKIFAQYEIPLIVDHEIVRPEIKDSTLYENDTLGYAEVRIPWIRSSSALELTQLVEKFDNNSSLAALYLEFPLGQKACGLFCEHAENLGFFFSGVMPCAFGTAAGIRLQRLTCDAQFSLQKIGDPFGRDLLTYVAGEAKTL